MDAAGSSNPQSARSIMGASEAGTIAPEPNQMINIIDGANNPNPQQKLKRDADQYMPISNINKIMRQVLPPHARIADDAKETIQECVSEFINFITAEANAKCNQDYRRTVTPQDLISGMGTLGFNNYVEPLNVYLDKISNQEGERTSTQSVKRSASLVHVEPQVTRPPPLPTGYEPTVATYANNYVGSTQMNDYNINNMGGYGQGSSSNPGLARYRHFK